MKKETKTLSYQDMSRLSIRGDLTIGPFPDPSLLETLQLGVLLRIAEALEKLVDGIGSDPNESSAQTSLSAIRVAVDQMLHR